MNILKAIGWVCFLVAGAWAVTGSIYAFLIWTSSTGYPHEMYQGLQHDGTYGASSPCCGNTDCEGVEWDDVTLHPDGSASFYSRRRGQSILVAAERITPVGLPPDPITKKVFPAHWCGKERGGPIYSPFSGSGHQEIEPPTAYDPDPKFITYCAFIAPGGT